MGIAQRFDELLRGTTHGLTCQITTNAGNLFCTCFLFFLGHGSLLESAIISLLLRCDSCANLSTPGSCISNIVCMHRGDLKKSFSHVVPPYGRGRCSGRGGPLWR